MDRLKKAIVTGLGTGYLPVAPGTCIFIPPGVRHRAVGEMTVLIVVLPKFDPDDEVIMEEDGR